MQAESCRCTNPCGSARSSTPSPRRWSTGPRASTGTARSSRTGHGVRTSSSEHTPAPLPPQPPPSPPPATRHFINIRVVSVNIVHLKCKKIYICLIVLSRCSFSKKKFHLQLTVQQSSCAVQIFLETFSSLHFFFFFSHSCYYAVQMFLETFFFNLRDLYAFLDICVRVHFPIYTHFVHSCYMLCRCF